MNTLESSGQKPILRVVQYSFFFSLSDLVPCLIVLCMATQ